MRRRFYRDPGYVWPQRSDLERSNFEQSEQRREEDRNRDRWDREHWERWLDTVRSNQRDPDEYGSVGGTPYEGGVFSSGTFGSGAEFYSVTGMYENPLLEKKGMHRGKGPKGYKRTDERIHDEICHRLTDHPLIDASLVDVQVKDGSVTLSGEILDRRMKHMAEDVADEVTGVKEVHNQLRVSRDRVA
jgi:osmotically-inducible protein OsmY